MSVDFQTSCEHFLRISDEGALAPSPGPTTAAQFCEEAARLVGGPREATHGDKSVNFRNIADLWNGWFKVRVRELWNRGQTIGQNAEPFDAASVSELMELFKIGRRHSGSYNPDDYVDTAGYAGCTGQIRSSEASATRNG